MSNKKYKIIFMIVALIVIITSIFLWNIPQSERILCEKSGGEYIKSSNEGGVFYYCKCSITQYETNSKTCNKITESDIDRCEELSNDIIICKNSNSYNFYYNEGVCECIFEDSGTKSYLTYPEILECSCKCSDGGCGCLC